MLTKLEDFYSKVNRLSRDDERAMKLQEIASRGLLYHVLQELLDVFENRSIESALDIGGGTGVNLSILGSYVDIHHAISADTFVPREKEPRVEYYRVSAENLKESFPPHSFDVIMMIEVIEHLVNPDMIIEAVSYLLKEEGVLVVTTPNLSSLLNRISLMLGYEPFGAEVSTRKVFGRPGSNVVGHLRLFTFRALIEFLESYGFRVLSAYTVANTFNNKLDFVEKLSTKLSSKLASRTIIVAKKP